MKLKHKTNIITKYICLLLVVCFIFPSSLPAMAEEVASDVSSPAGQEAEAQPLEEQETDNAAGQNNSEDKDGGKFTIEATYEEVSSKYGSLESYGLTGNEVIEIKAENVIPEEGVTPDIQKGYKGYEGYSVMSNKAAGALSWDFEVPKTGLYEIYIDYIPFDDDKSDIQRKIYIDGELPFRESGSIGFLRKWYEASPPRKDINGDEVKPKLAQVIEWSTNAVTDVDGMTNRPFSYLLTAGKHRLTIDYLNANIRIGNIVIKPATRYKTYKEVLAEYEQKGYKKYTGTEPIRVEGEEADFRSAQILRREPNSDPATSPYVRGHVVLNTIGGWNWRKANQKVEWKITVPESALYKINLRIFQNHGEGLNVYRQLTIDGEVPFEEVSEYAFGYSNKWQDKTITDENGEPYLFYLEKGEHTIALQVKMGKAAPTINELYAINDKVSDLIRNITKVTGSDPDLNFDYELEKKVPTLLDDMKEIRDRYRAQVAYLIEISERTPTLANSLNTAADQLDYYIRKPNKIPAKLDELKTTQSSLSNWFFNIQDQPMMIDYLQLLAPDSNFKMKKSTVIEKFLGTVVNFINSFFKDYDSITVVVDNADIQSSVTLDIWAARSKEMCEVIQQMSLEDFTTETGIGVKINIMPGGSVGAVGSISPLTLAIISGKVPDLAMGSDQSTPVELAIRDKAYNLKNFPDYEEVAKRFLPGAITPLEYRGGVYAFPETMDFKMLFYRADILDEIGLEVPNTWTDVYNKIFPVLDQHALEFYMAKDYAPFLFQNGGEYFNKDRTKIALDTDVAYRAFLQWTKLYTVYDMDESADIYNHFRFDDMPLAIGTYADYIRIQYAAPELYGRWSIAPIPGTLREDGTIDRSAGGAVSTLLMFTDTKYKEEAWEFVKWWTGAEVQYNFSIEIEAIMGPEARFNTANVEGFLKLPWPEEHVEVFKESWKYYKNQPNTLGGYYVTRNIDNAWTRVVLNDMNPRKSWEKAIDDIESEMLRKQKEYGLVPEE